MINELKREAATSDKKALFTGLANVTIAAINPTRAEVNKMFNQLPSEKDTEIEYVTTNDEGDKMLTLVFYLHCKDLDRYFPLRMPSIKAVPWISEKTGKKMFVNDDAKYSWANDVEDLPEYITSTIINNVKVNRTVRAGFVGENHLIELLNTWINTYYCQVLLDMDKLFEEDYTEIRSLIHSKYSRTFTVLMGVRTDELDSEKKYQNIFTKKFLPFNNDKDYEISSDSYVKSCWTKFKKELTGEYGFQAYYELTKVTDYDPTKDIASQEETVSASAEVMKNY